MQMRNLFTTSVLAAAVCAVPTFAADTSEEVKEAGQAVTNDVKDGADKAADKTKKEWKETKGDMKDAKHDMKHDMKDGKHDMKDAKHDMSKDGSAASALKLPAGITPDDNAGLERSQDLREILTEISSAAVTEDGFNDLVERLVDQDRNRIGKADLNYDGYNAAVNRFRANWKNKFGHDFELDEKNVFTAMNVISGEVSNGQVAMVGWPVKPTDATAGPTDAVAAANVITGDKAEDAEDRREDANLQEGRDVALARIASANNTHLTLSFIDEAGGWKLDLPNNITGNLLLSRVTNCIDQANGMKDQWPGDENQAKQVVTGKLINAIYGIDGNADKAQKAGAIMD